MPRKQIAKAPVKKGAGGKLNRSEIVQTRLSPRLRFYAEIMARHQRRSLSSLIENLLEQAAADYQVPMLIAKEPGAAQQPFAERHYVNTSLRSSSMSLWLPEESDRLAGLGLYTPDLLTYEEEQVWQLIRECPYFWDHIEVPIKSETGEVIGTKEMPLITLYGLIRKNLREYWPLLSAILQGKESAESFKKLELPKGKK